MDDGDHYLKDELYRKVREDPAIFDFLQEGSLDGLWYWDLEHPEHEWMNARFWEILGFDPAERQHLASEWQDLIHPEDLQRALENFHAHCADPSHPYDQVVRYLHADGSTVWVRCRGLAIRGERGQPVRMLGAHTELTSLKRTEAALRLRVQDLNDFVTITSHDLQAPLRRLRQLSEMLSLDEAERLSPDGRHLLGLIVREASGAQELVRDLLTLLHADRPEEAIEQVALDDCVDSALALLGQGGAQPAFALARAELPSVRGDEVLLTRLFQNLLENALKFSGGDPDIAITAERGIGAWILGVRDSGPGVLEAEVDRIFQPFVRGSMVNAVSGTGIGLAICQKVVARHGGRIWVERAPGGGAHFKFTLPAWGEAGARPGHAANGG